MKGLDYAALVGCLETLRGKHAPGSPPIGSIAANPGTPAATLLYVANVLRCREITCAPGRIEPPLVDFRYFRRFALAEVAKVSDAQRRPAGLGELTCTAPAGDPLRASPST